MPTRSPVSRATWILAAAAGLAVGMGITSMAQRSSSAGPRMGHAPAAMEAPHPSEPTVIAAASTAPSGVSEVIWQPASDSPEGGAPFAQRAAPVTQRAAPVLGQLPAATAAAAASVSASNQEGTGVAPSPPPFDRAAATKAMGNAAAAASACGGLGDGSVRSRVAVTFAASGRVTVALVEGDSPLRGTSQGACVAQRMRSATVPAFDGAPVTVHGSVVTQ